MSKSIQEKDWWTMFAHMSQSKLNQRHNEYVDKYPTNAEGYWFIQIHGTEFVQLKFKDDINETLIQHVSTWSEKRENTKKIGYSTSDSDVLELKNLLLGRASDFVDFCSKSNHPKAEQALWGIWEVVDIKWPQKSFIAPEFYDIWGWIQLELGKKGLQQMPRTQQYERQLKEYCKVNKFSIEDIRYDSQMNVKYLVKEC
ncbi:hypothetical protein N9N24_03670 [Candidatus Marinimicrobia bacterium]|nr:hypothetical protein [Candidatus Neomarinimicrobiota bacterium]